MSNKERGFRLQSVKAGAENLVNLFRVAPQWAVPSLVFGAISLSTTGEGIKRFVENPLEAGSYAVGAGVSFALAAYTGDSARYYLEEYKKTREVFKRRGWSSRIANMYISYYCGRRMVRYAAYDEGYREDFDRYLSTTRFF